MLNNYKIELSNSDFEVKASIFLDSNCLGRVWIPNNKLLTKNDFQELFIAIGNVVYGQEQKAKKEEESDSKLLEALQTKSKRKQEDVSETET